MDSVQRLTPPQPQQSGGMSFCREREGALYSDSTVSPDGHLEIGHQWSEQRHVDWFK